MQQTDRKKTTLIIIITLLTVVLGGVAVVTAMKLRQMATVPVTPNVPVSQPQAAVTAPTTTSTDIPLIIPNHSFEKGSFADWHVSPAMHPDDTFVVDAEVDQGANDGRYYAKLVGNDEGDAFVSSAYIDVNKDVTGKNFEVVFNAKAHTQTAIVKNLSLQRMPKQQTDGGEYDWTDASVYLPELELTTTWQTFTHTLTFPTPANGNVSEEIRLVLRPSDKEPFPQPIYYDNIRIKEIVSSTGGGEELACSTTFTVVNSVCNAWCDDDADCSGDNFCLIEDGEEVGVCRNPDCTGQADCTCAEVVPTPSPTPLVSCDADCDSDSDCEGNLVCSSGSCRNPSCTNEADCACADPTPSPTPTTPADPTPTTPASTTTPQASCNQSCSDDGDCSGSNICNQGVCRNPSCTGEADCTCASSQSTPEAPVPTTPTLPQAGNDVPTLVLLSLGAVILLMGVAGLLVL